MAFDVMDPQNPLVLIVDADKTVHEHWGDFLEASGFEVAHAFDGRGAVDAVDLLVPQVVVMECHLPWRNGLEVAKLLKTRPQTSMIRIVLVSREWQGHHRRLANRAGCDAFLVKPCPPERLRQAIVEVLHTIERAPPRLAPRLLLVEDDPSERQAVHQALEEEGFEVADAANGLEALAQLRSGAARPDLIVLDLMMPLMNGWQFRAAQRKDRELAAIPVVALTAVPSSKRAGLDVGFCLTKPLHLAELFGTIEKALAH